MLLIFGHESLNPLAILNIGITPETSPGTFVQMASLQ
jgi:hypothetical protein